MKPTIKYQGFNNPVLIGFDYKQSKPLWIIKPKNGVNNNRIIRIIDIDDYNFYAIGLSDIENSKTGQRLWVTKFSTENNITEKQLFSDNFNSIPLPDSAIIGSILQGRINADSSGNKYLVAALSIYQKDTSQIKPISAIASLSEYLGNYEMASKAYGKLIKKLNKIKQKADIEKARAHQITCNFLAHSNKMKPAEKSIDESKTTKGYYESGIEFTTENKQIYISSVAKTSPAERAGIKPFDEIVQINGTAITQECSTPKMIQEKLIGNQSKEKTILIKRFGEDNLVSINCSDLFKFSIPNKSFEQKKPDVPSSDYSGNQPNVQLEDKQNFIKKIISSVKQDTLTMKKIENAKRIGYALLLINKWGENKAGKNFNLQIEEQVGMLVSLLNLIGNKKIDLQLTGGEVITNNKETIELTSNTYAKESQQKFDGIAKTQPLNETKIDDNITFVQKNNNSKSGYYKCIDNFSANAPTNAKKYSCFEPETWVSSTSEVNCETKNKESFAKIIFSGTEYTFEMTRETIISPCKTGNEGVTFYNGGGYTKIQTQATGNFDIRSSTIVSTFTTTTFMKMEPSRNVFHFLETNEDKTTPGYEKTVSGEPKKVTQNIEFLTDSRIKFTSEYGWAIYQKVKEL